VKVRDYGSDSMPQPKVGLRLSKILSYNGQKKPVETAQGDEKDSKQYVVSFQQDGFNRSVGKIVDPGGLNLKP